MYPDAETFGNANVDLYLRATNQTAKMREQLVAFDKNDPNAAKIAIQNITTLRVYHQITRIIRYLDMMDKIEDKIYESIDMSLQDMDPADQQTWFKLVSLQEKLQRTMIDSHKLLEPYLNMETLSIIEIPQRDDPQNSFASILIDQESREKLRTSAQEVLAAIERGDIDA